MEDVRQLVQEEGREARNLVAFHVAVDTPNRVARKPPRTGAPPPRRLAPRSAARLRSASAGRDKRSELRARYWALLFGDLQRAVGEIYNTVEAHENINECQEVILVLENYTRDFKALSEWFRLKWEYDNTPPPQRPQSLAWEIRKTDFVRPESRRTNSVRSSPSVSGKNSPCLSGHNTPSGKNSPNPTGKSSPGSGKISPRIAGHSSTSPKGTIEFFSNKIASKIATKPEAKIGKDTRLSDIKEKDMVVIDGNILVDQKVESEEKGEGGLTSSSEDTSMNSKVSDVVSDIENSRMEQNVTKASENDEFTVIPTNEALSDNVDLDTALIKGNNKEIYKTQQNITPASNDGINNLKSDNASKTNPDIKIPENTCVKIGEPATKSSKNENKEVNMQEKSNDKEFAKTKIAKTSPINGKDKETATINTPKDQYVKITNDVEKTKVCKINLSKDTSKHVVEIGKAKEMANVVAKPVIIKNRRSKTVTEDKKAAASTELSNQAKATIAKLDIMENEYLAKNLIENTAKNDNLLNGDIENNNNKILQNDKTVGPETDSTMFNNSDTQLRDPKKEDNDSKKTDIKTSEVKTPRPAYSQAAAKPKLVTAKEEVKPTTKTLYRSKTVVEIRPNSAPTRQTRQFVNRNQKSKCSYPFNLTTGRTSLFDTPGTSKVIATKRPLGRPQMAAGDARNQIKPDLKTRPPRPNSLKINEQGDKKEKINPALENLKDHNDYGSSDTVITQIDMNRNESSESLKTLVPEGYDVGNSIEVLNVDADKTDNDGWLTVKSRRLSRESKKSKSHWANRFNQPSATTSLPTLNMMESPKSETNPIEKIDRAKSEQPQNKPEKVVTVTEEKEPKSAINAKDMSMIRQKSDVTGLKTKTSRNKALKKDKNKEEKKDCDLAKNNRLHSSLESLTISLARSQESTEEVFDFDKWKAEFMTTLYTNYLEDDDQTTKDDEILKTADPSEMSEIAEMTSQIEENERRISLALDFQSEVDEIKLCQEEDLLNRQIMELQQVSDNDLDTETDDTETDAEILCEDSNIVPCPTDNMSCRDLASCLEHHYESALEGMSWSERVDMLGALEELVARDPGRAQQLHAKLSQGIKRRGSLQDVLRRLQAKQARAEKQRMQLHTERAKKIHQLLGRVEEVKMAKNQLIEEKRNRMERRLQKAAENRDQHLKDIVRKAHDEEEKLREIAFIKQLEAENRRHEFLEQCRSFTIRLREMRRERFDKLEQKAAREAAVGARRQALEAARKQHVESLLEKRKERDARREELKELKRQERDDAAREKAEGVKSRLSALAAAAELEADALRSRIRDKQDASQQRLESHLQAIREKATGPRQPTTSETQDQTSVAAKEQDEEIVKLEQERKERERQKVLRKKARKLKQKIIVSSRETNLLYTQAMQAFLPPSLGKMQRVVNQLSVLISPLIPDYKPGSTDFDNISKRIKVSDIEEKQEFKYDFEEKMGKKKKKKRSQETQNNNDDHKNNNQIEQESKGAKRKSKNKDDQKQDNDDSKATKNNVQEATQNGNNDTNKQANDQKRDSTCNNAQTDHSKLNGTVGEEIQGATTNKVQKPKNNAQSSKNEGHSKNEAHSSKNGAQSGKNDKNKNKNEDKNAKNKDKNDTQRLSKSNSICSSVSDMSGYVRAITKLDIMTLEKLIGELYRASTAKDCNDNLRPKMKTQDASNMMKLHTVKTLGRLLSILAEREDLLAQISLKCVTMIVVTCSRVMVSGPSSALYFFNSPAAAHVISLLCYQLGKDLKDPKELELAKQLSDLVSVCLDAALCETRLQQYDGDPNAPIVAIRARAHNLISYLCLGGCVSRAEHAGEARERMQTLVTLCADLCQPHKADAGPERASALQSLRVALGTSLMGSRAEFCMLFAVGAELSRSRDFVRAARTAHLLRQLAELDHQLVQDAFGEGGWPLEFRAAVARLLSQHAPNDKEAPNSDALHLSNQRLDLNLSEQMVLDLIVLVGYVVVNNPQLHETICENWGVIKTLCTLPANWLVSETHAPALLPTLAVLAERPDTAKIISSEISTKMLEDFINSEVGQKVKMIQILKTGREKAAKKEKQGKKEKPNPTEQTDNAIDGNKAEANNTEKDSIVGNKKENECNVSDNDSIEEV